MREDENAKAVKKEKIAVTPITVRKKNNKLAANIGSDILIKLYLCERIT